MNNLENKLTYGINLRFRVNIKFFYTLVYVVNTSNYSILISVFTLPLFPYSLIIIIYVGEYNNIYNTYSILIDKFTKNCLIYNQFYVCIISQKWEY
jgi:hypothetical protein